MRCSYTASIQRPAHTYFDCWIRSPPIQGAIATLGRTLGRTLLAAPREMPPDGMRLHQVCSRMATFWTGRRVVHSMSIGPAITGVGDCSAFRVWIGGNHGT